MKPVIIKKETETVVLENRKKYIKERNTKLILSIFVDILGNISYFAPALGETIDIPWAPISGALIFMMYRTNKKIAFTGGFMGFAEEIFPLSDFLPTATSLWLYTYVFNKKKD